MLTFDSTDPFPLVSLDSVSYSDLKDHSAQVDAWLGLRTSVTETSIEATFDREAAKQRDERHWIGLPVEALLTPYIEIRFLLEQLKPLTGSIVDLGAGYGRMGFVIAKHFPSINFLGIEVVEERVREGSSALKRYLATLNSLSRADQIRLVAGDLTAAGFSLPEANIYFLYDYGSASAIEKTLRDLMQMSLQRSIVVVGRGGATRDAIEKRHPWLSVQTPRHFPHFSIYRS
jgi:hypothetical protein